MLPQKPCSSSYVLNGYSTFYGNNFTTPLELNSWVLPFSNLFIFRVTRQFLVSLTHGIFFSYYGSQGAQKLSGY